MSGPRYRVVEWRGKWAVRFGGKRYSLSLDATPGNRAQAETLAAIRYNAQTSPVTDTIGPIVLAYIDYLKAENKDHQRPTQCWGNLAPKFQNLLPESLTRADCDDYIKARLKKVSSSTVKYEMGLIRRALNWAKKERLIREVPYVKLPPESPPREHWLTREQYKAFLDHCTTPHVYLFVVLAITTAARAGAILDLTWDRVDFNTKRINLRNLEKERTNKGRAVVPMNHRAEAALKVAYEGRQTDYVIEYAGQPVGSIKKALQRISAKTGIKASSHVFRHSAAVWMAQDGVPMAEIAEYLGHENTYTTERHYAKFSPQYLQGAAKSLDW